MPIDYRQFPVLYVDDDRANLVSLRYAIEDEFTVLTAGRGEEALRILTEENVAILVADQRMPGMTGVEVCARARELKPDTVRMILTAYADVQAAMDAINQGQVMRYITKPWKPDQLKAVLRTGIDVFNFRGAVHDLEIKILQGERAATVVAVAAELDHELRQWLTIMRAGMDVVADTAKGLAGHENAETLASVAADGLHAADMAISLLRRLGRGDERTSGEPLEADVNRVVEMASGIMRTELARKARFESFVDGKLEAQITPTELAQVLINLLSNACQGIPEGDPSRYKVAIHASRSAGTLQLAVSDTGPGIDPGDLEKIFDPYFTTRPEGEGTGLGLAIVKKIIARRGGSISVTSELGKGTTFAMELLSIPR